MYLKAALSAIPRPRSATLPTRSLTKFTKADLSRLLDYQRVCGFRLTERLPLGYPHIMGFDLAMRLMTASDFPFPVIGLVHVANRIEQQRWLTADEELAITVRAENEREHQRGKQFDVVTEVSVDAEPVWREASTYLRITHSQEREKREPAPLPTPHAIWRVGPEVGSDYARVSGDHNPIHTSWVGARIFGFPRPIAHGMWSMARCLAALEGRLHAQTAVDVAFKLPLLLPAKVGFIHSGDHFSLFDARSGKPHLSGRIHA